MKIIIVMRGVCALSAGLLLTLGWQIKEGKMDQERLSELAVNSTFGK